MSVPPTKQKELIQHEHSQVRRALESVQQEEGVTTISVAPHKQPMSAPPAKQEEDTIEDIVEDRLLSQRENQIRRSKKRKHEAYLRESLYARQAASLAAVTQALAQVDKGNPTGDALALVHARLINVMKHF